eukprot:g11803.t1
MTLSASHTGWVVSNVEYQHWKVNGLRSVGGDGISSVRPGGRRAGCGFAHSGEAKGHNEVGALLEPQGWFEADDDEWVGVTLSLTTRRASSLRSMRLQLQSMRWAVVCFVACGLSRQSWFLCLQSLAARSFDVPC